jgi:hypothetical protein
MGLSGQVRPSPETVLQLSRTPEFWLHCTQRMIKHLRSPRNRRKVERWVLVAEATTHGSTFSQAICEYLGLNPHERV